MPGAAGGHRPLPRAAGPAAAGHHVQVPQGRACGWTVHSEGVCRLSGPQATAWLLHSGLLHQALAWYLRYMRYAVSHSLHGTTTATTEHAPARRSDGELVVTLVTKHLVRMLKTASSLQVLDAATFAIQVRHA